MLQNSVENSRYFVRRGEKLQKKNIRNGFEGYFNCVNNFFCHSDRS